MEGTIKNEPLRGVMGRHELGFSSLGQEQVVGTCECGNELSWSIKCWEFLDYLRTC